MDPDLPLAVVGTSLYDVFTSIVVVVVWRVELSGMDILHFLGPYICFRVWIDSGHHLNRSVVIPSTLSIKRLCTVPVESASSTHIYNPRYVVLWL